MKNETLYLSLKDGCCKASLGYVFKSYARQTHFVMISSKNRLLSGMTNVIVIKFSFDLQFINAFAKLSIIHSYSQTVQHLQVEMACVFDPNILLAKKKFA